MAAWGYITPLTHGDMYRGGATGESGRFANVSCVFSCSNRMALWLKKKHAREPMRTLLLVPCAQRGVMHSLGRSLGRAEEPNIIFEDGPWGVLQTSSAYSLYVNLEVKLSCSIFLFNANVLCTLLKYYICDIFIQRTLSPVQNLGVSRTSYERVP